MRGSSDEIIKSLKYWEKTNIIGKNCGLISPSYKKAGGGLWTLSNLLIKYKRLNGGGGGGGV